MPIAFLNAIDYSSVDAEEDIRMANSDNREATISEIIAYKEDIYRRTDKYFCVRYDDGSTLWQQYEPGKYGLNRDLRQLRILIDPNYRKRS